MCKEQPKQPNVDVPEERCVEVPRDITKDVCYKVPKQTCVDVPKEHCKEVVNKHHPIMNRDSCNPRSHDIWDKSFEKIHEVVEHDNDREADQEGYTSAALTEGAKENISNKWTASRPVTPDNNETDTKWELNSNIIEGLKSTWCCLKTRPPPSQGTRPTQH